MILLILIFSLIGGIIGLAKKYKRSRFAGMIKGLSIGAFVGLIASLIYMGIILNI